jgi:hypothetical protein
MLIPELEYSEKPRARAWTYREEEIIRDYYPLPKNVQVKVIADYLNRSCVSVKRKIANMRITRHG